MFRCCDLYCGEVVSEKRHLSSQALSLLGILCVLEFLVDEALAKSAWRETFCPPWYLGVVFAKPRDVIVQPKEPGLFESIIPERRFPRFAHQAGFAQHAQMLRNGRPTHIQPKCQLADR